MKTLNNNQIYKVSFIIAFLLFATGLVGVLSPSANKYIKNALNSSPRVVLSTAQGKLFNGTPIEVVKVKTQNGLFIEVYDLSRENVHPLIDRLQLPDLQDGFILFQGKATNLALHDVDGDSHHEIIAPSFDENLVAHLNVYQFNKQLNKYELKKTKN